MDRKRIQAIMKLLADSVKTGLNASLSPSDCRFLLLYFAKAVIPQRTPIDHIMKKLTKLAHETLDAVGEDLRKGKL